MSLEARASTWCTPGRPLAVGGPSKKTNGRSGSPPPSAFSTMPCSFHHRPTSCSRDGKDTFVSTFLKAMAPPLANNHKAPSPPWRRGHVAPWYYPYWRHPYGRALSLLVSVKASRVLYHSGDPVSYTHLRAHETRHDLVCRL